MALLGLVVATALINGVPAAAQTGTDPTPAEVCAPVRGTPEYETCLTVARQALDNAGGPGATVTPGTVAPTDGARLAEESLREQRELLWVIVAVVMVLLCVVVGLSWWRAMRRLRASFPPEQQALLEELVPPEVRAEHPDVEVRTGLTLEEQSMLRGHRNLIVFLLVLPAAVFVLLQVWEPSVDTSVAIGEVARVAPIVLALPALWWARRRVRRALEAGEDRWAVLGLHADSGPDPMVVPRAGGGLRSAVIGPMVLTGVRHGREVRIEASAGVLRTAVRGPDAMPSSGPFGSGPGPATLSTEDGWIVLERRLSGSALAGPDGLTTLLRDLRDVERAASAAGPITA